MWYLVLLYYICGMKMRCKKKNRKIKKEFYFLCERVFAWFFIVLLRFSNKN